MPTPVYNPTTGSWEYPGAAPGSIRAGILRTVAGNSSPALVAPSLSDEVVLQRQLERKQRLASLRGRASTFLTGPRGVGLGLPTSDIAMAFLRSAIDAEPQYGLTSDTTQGREANAGDKWGNGSGPVPPRQPYGRRRGF